MFDNDSDEAFIFNLRLLRSKVTLFVGILGLVVGLVGGGFFLYLILTNYTDDLSLLFSTGIFAAVGAVCLIMSISLKRKLRTETPELWDAYQKMRRAVPGE